ncbi:MAG: hypothetical protein Q7S17_09975 [Xanthobacteraceae bacterium]|nr:hypothetical protein [Xanthobacteraceae bacterium]
MTDIHPLGKTILTLAEAAAKQAVAAERKCIATALQEIHSALDDGLGDLDVTYMDDDELRESHPVQWATCKLAGVIESLEE